MKERGSTIYPACKKNGGRTPLHSACQNGCLDVAKYLVDEKNCDPACKKNDGRTPVSYTHLTLPTNREV